MSVMMSPLAIAAPVGASSATKPAGLLSESAVAPATAQGQGAFAALLAATLPQGGAQIVAGNALITPQETDPAQNDPAMAALLAETNGLIQTLQADGATTDLSAMVVAFVGLLQRYDAATGGDTAAVFLQNLAALDGADFAALNAATLDPAALMATLGQLAGLPMVPQADVVSAMSVQQHATQPDFPVTADPRRGVQTAHNEPRHLTAAPAQPIGVTDAGTLTDVALAQTSANAPVVAQTDLRGAVLSAVNAAIFAPQADVLPAGTILSEQRMTPQALPDVARPADVAPPPQHGFARNLAQQIKQATFGEGQTRISLAPRGLGEIEIDMGPDEAGNLRIVLRADNPAVLQALRGDRDGLLQTLTSSGTEIRDADLSFEDFSQRQQRDTDRTAAPIRPQTEAPQDEPDTAYSPPNSTVDGALDMLT